MAKRLNGEGTIYYAKSKKKWVAAVQVEGKKVPVYCETPEQAVDELAKLRIKYGLIKLSGEIPLQDWVSEWLFVVKAGSISDTTIQNYHGQLKKYLLKYPLAKMKIADIKKLDVVRHFNTLLNEGVSKQSMKKLKTRLNSLFTDASDMIIKNPMEGFDVPSRARDNSRVNTGYNAYTKEEQIKLMNRVLQSEDEFIYDTLNFFIYFALGTGLRAGELFALKYDRDFNKDFTEMYVTKSWRKSPIYEDKKLIRYEYMEKTTKTKAGKRTIPIPDVLSAKIRTRVTELKKLSLSDKYFNNQKILFPNEVGGHLDDKRPLYRINKFNKELGLSKVTIHGLRHTYATRLLEAGENIQVISNLLGHANTQITMNIYTHVLTDLKKKTAEKVNEVLSLVST